MAQGNFSLGHFVYVAALPTLRKVYNGTKVPDPHCVAALEK